jgi:hypothetical protein
VSFFGPVISRIPSDEEAVPLWNAVLTLTQFPGFAEIKRSLREAPQLRILGTLISDSRVWCDQELNERTKQRFATRSDVVHKREETEVQRG